MNLSELSIRRHVLAFMLSAVIILFGVVGYQGLGVDRMPNIDFPVVTITTTMTGANPEIVDASITNLIESAVNSIPGIEHIESRSSPGVSVVAVRFSLTKNVDVAFTEVQAKVNQVLRNLPNTADPPVVAKVEIGSAPVLWLALQGDRTQQQLNQYARNIIKKRLETIEGVGEVRLGGERQRTIRIHLDTRLLTALDIAPQEVVKALRNEHLQMPGGFLVDGQRESLIKLDLEFHSVAALGELVITHREGTPILLRQVARLEDGLADYRQVAHFNSEPTVSIGIVKVTGANTVAVVDAVMARIAGEIIPRLPPGMILRPAVDSKEFIAEKMVALKEHLALGTLFSALVVWLFLRSFRATLIISAAIPVSLLGSVVVMYFFDYTFNTMTLLAMLLLIGVVVDDAIVVLENIYRHREEGMEDPQEAAIHGTNQVLFAVLAATLTLVSIFAPVVFLGGIIGKFFRAFAVVVTFGVLTSYLVALTLTPMLCSRHLRVYQRHGLLYRALDGLFRAMDNGYRRLLAAALRYRWLVVLATLAILYPSGWFFSQIGKDFLPDEDEGRFLISFKTPLGSSLDYTVGRLVEIEKILARHPEGIAGYLATIGEGATGQVNQGAVDLRMTERDHRTIKQSELIAVLRQELAAIPGVLAFPSPMPLVSGMRGEPLQFVLAGPSLEEVARLSKELLARLANDPELGRVDLGLDLELPQLRMTVDRLRAAELGLAGRDVAESLSMAAGGLDVAKFNDEPGDGERYYLRIKAEESQISQPTDLRRILVRTRTGELIRLDTVAGFQAGVGPAVVSRLDLQYAAYFYTSPLIPLGAAVSKVMAVGQEILPPGYAVKMIGRAEEFNKTASYMKFTFIMALVLVYMVLASQFNSFIQPMIIMVAQPLAIIGGVAGLWLFDHSLNIYSMIGLVLLMGLVAKNSILLVDLTNSRRQQGQGIIEALQEACPVRMRPVLMTSFTIILAMLPAAMGMGAGSDTNAPLGVAVIGGMISSTLLTLVVVPAVYSLVEGGLQRLRQWRTR